MGVAPVNALMTEHRVDDPFTTIIVLEAAHGTRSSSYLSKDAFNSIGGPHFAPVSLGHSEEH